MSKRFRESKYLNESGSNTGNWYLNRLDYFQFHQYPKYKKHKYGSAFLGLFFLITALKLATSSMLLALPCFYLCYVALKTFCILQIKTCRYKGYFLYPNKIVSFLREREVEVDLNDFDSVATMSKK